MNIVHPKTFYFGFAVAILGVIVLAMRMNLDSLTAFNVVRIAAVPLLFIGVAMLPIVILSTYRDTLVGYWRILDGGVSAGFSLHYAWFPQSLDQTSIGYALVMLTILYGVCALVLMGPSVAKRAPISPNRALTDN